MSSCGARLLDREDGTVVGGIEGVGIMVGSSSSDQRCANGIGGEHGDDRRLPMSEFFKLRRRILGDRFTSALTRSSFPIETTLHR